MKDTLEILQYNKLKDLIQKHIQTEYGKEQLKKLKPIFDIELAKSNFQMLNEFFEHFTKWGALVLDDVFIKSIIEDSFNGMLDEKELKSIGNFISLLLYIKEEIEQNNPELYEEYINFDIPLSLLDEINKTIDDYGFLKDSATAHLFEIRQQKQQISQNITRILKNLMHGRLRDILLDTAIFLKRSRYTLLLKPNYKEYISGRIIDIGKSGGFFVEPDAVFKENSHLEDITAQEEAERRRILTNLTHQVRENANRLRHNEKKLGVFDVIVAKYHYSKNLPECDIEFSSDPIIKAKRAKHPILAAIKEKTIPVDIDLSTNRKLIITGPNTGGKTVFLKTIGLLIVGIFSAIPPNAEQLTIGSFDNVFAIIGDEQDIFESLSGFSSKIVAFREAFKKATSNTMMLIDEIGSGTSPDEGEAVAYSIIKNTAKKCPVCATTHYKKLAYILESEGFRVAAFEFNTKTLKPTYKLTYDRIGKSYGIEILKTLNVDKQITNEAHEFYSNQASIFNKLEGQLQKTIEHYTKAKNALAKTKERYINLIENEKKEKEELIQKLKEEQYQKQKEYEKLLESLKNEISQLLKTKNISKAHKKINQIKQQSKNLFKDEKQKQEVPLFRVGEAVLFNGLKGTITSIKSDKATVEIEGKLLNVKLSSLSKIEHKKEEKQIKVNTKLSDVSLELNLIGKRRDEAYFDLVKFIDSLSLQSIKTARIVHGIGNGILKDMVRETLKQLPHVKEFHPAPPHEGGDGATIVELK
ncbi:endonuclease MutS2 [Hippea maritima]|uniref:Endonuclease MutS2 n=1 Tax=Hippea maritima (strain ATCC 700847 / DSM 10411 / MH2) TaxID=760142 RepID=F2LUE2_HIPMA|nr:Smr/MutS family protein [Hippea maritima]AEA33468.1 Smr protein/MutS2 [Hippea maritima DSM 10411]